MIICEFLRNWAETKHLHNTELGFVPPKKHIYYTQAQHMAENPIEEQLQRMTNIPAMETNLCLHPSIDSILLSTAASTYLYIPFY